MTTDNEELSKKNGMPLAVYILNSIRQVV